MIITVIGLGHIGGSIAISLKENGFAKTIIGCDTNLIHEQKALDNGLINKVLDLSSAIKIADIIIVATPVNTLVRLLPKILHQLRDGQVVIDVGSTKKEVVAATAGHPRRGQFIATHPMSGTEFSGPESAVLYQFDGKVTVFCDTINSDANTINVATRMYRSLRMRIVEIDATSHDTHVAYISHISHIASFALAITVLEKEKDEHRIFELASSGFSSTVRLAKSAPETWIPIFEQNQENVLDVLDQYIHVLQDMRANLASQRFDKLRQQIAQANDIKRVLTG